MIGERAQHVIKELADQDDLFAIAECGKKLLDCFAAQLRFQHVMEVLFAKQVQPVPANAAQKRVQNPSGERAAHGVGKWTRQRHSRPTQPSRPTLRETLRIPGEKADQPHGAHFKQRALHAPIGRAAGRTSPLRVFYAGYGFRHTNKRLSGKHTHRSHPEYSGRMNVGTGLNDPEESALELRLRTWANRPRRR